MQKLLRNFCDGVQEPPDPGRGGQQFAPSEATYSMTMKVYTTASDRRLWATFVYRQDEFLAHCDKRPNAESTFSATKRGFGEAVRSKKLPAQVNEILCKILCHNLSVLVHTMHELRIEPTFAPSTQVA